MVDKLVCLVGESYSGKTTLVNMLRPHFNVVDSYTTRPKREPNEIGHIFVNSFVHTDNVIEHSIIGGYHYWTTQEQYINKGLSIHTIDACGVKQLITRLKCPIIVVKVVRPHITIHLTDEVDLDTSKRLSRKILTDIPCSFILHNSGTITEFYNKALELLKKIN